MSQASPSRPMAADITLMERHALRLVRNLGSPTRAQMARELRLTATAAMRLVESLTAKGLLREGAKIADGPGQPSATVMLVPDAAYAFGISIMTDAFVVLLMDLEGKVISERTVACVMSDRDETLHTIKTAIDTAIADLRLQREKILGVGLGIPGFFINGSGQLNTPDPIEGWSFVNLEAVIGDQLEFAVRVENDGNAAAVGEAMVGIGRWAPSFAYLYFADGFGGGVVINGEPMRGSHGNAGEFAASLVPTGMPKPDLRLLRKCLAESGTPTASVADLCDRFDPDWPGVDTWIDQATPALTYIASAISAVLDPDAIVLGGRIPNALAPLLVERITIDSGDRRARGRHVPPLVPSETQADAVALGAAAIVMKAALYA